jgi:glycine C-acetyltransferase
MPHVFLAPTGWSAAFAAVAGIVRREDHVVMDVLAHQCLQQAAYGSTKQVHLARHLDVGHMEEIVTSIRATDADGGIVLITEGLFSMDGDAPDFRALVDVARRFDALTVVDVAHDLGALGPGGSGSLGAQRVLSDIDVVTGAFSKSFGTTGGFVATHDPNLYWAQLCFGGPYTYSTALSPVQVAVARSALAVSAGPEGDVRRATLMQNVHHTRAGAEARGLRLLGAPSPIVPVHIGGEALSRLAGRASFKAGLLATCLEFPVVSRNEARYRLSLSPEFSIDMLDRALDIIRASLDEAAAQLTTRSSTAA